MSSKFTSKLQKTLRKKLFKELSPEYDIKSGEWNLAKSLDEDIRLPVDIYGESPKSILIVELESHRADPSNNVAKVFYWHEKHGNNKKVLFFQWLSPHYQRRAGGDKAKSILCSFLAKRLQKDGIEYHPIKFDIKNFKEIYDNREDKNIRKISKRISDEITEQMDGMLRDD